MEKLKLKKETSSIWFRNLRNQICKYLESVEAKYASKKNTFIKKKWDREPNNKDDLGGGEMSILRGVIFEKAGVNISTVYGELSDKIRDKIPGTKENGKFWASGISVVIHPKSPKVPAVHMNTRLIKTEKIWFGGGADITPINKQSIESLQFADLFHKNFELICEKYQKGCYQKFKKWCDDYFFLPHRNEHRGLGGIFYDYLNSGDWNLDFQFTKNVGETFLETYKKIVEQSVEMKWTESEVKIQNLRRSRYVEFNLLYDRGTKFGLLTNGNPEAILMSLPPSATW